MNGLADKHVLPPGPGLHEVPSTGLAHLRFALARVPGGEEVVLDTGLDEALVVLMEAPAEAMITVDGEAFALPARDSVFDEQPAAIYAPPGASLRLHGEMLAGIFRAEALAGAPEAYAIRPEEVETVERGSGNFKRHVRDILPASRPGTRLLVGETINPPGNWSSSPPHKHDRDIPPEEARLEEIYAFRLDPSQGFGLQLSYSVDPPADRPLMVRDLDVVSIPSGYHPVVAGPGYRLYYLWGLAGAGRELHWFADPSHAWADGT